MVWRGYDIDTIDLNKSDKSIHEAVEDLVDRLVKDIRKSQKRAR
jgi:ribosome-associated translation inhibitor RaiA